jgi:sterol 3beta-glucosyltransferase
MKAVLASLGTSGDFEPLLALAAGLKARGHSPILANSPDYADRARRHAIPFVPLGPPLAELGLTRCLEEILGFGNPLDQARAMIACTVPCVPRMVEELDHLCATADVLVCLPYQLAGFMSHERTGTPYIAWNFSPFGAILRTSLGQATADIINRCRLELGLQARPNPFEDATARSRLALFATSSHLFRRPRSWPEHYHLTGYFFLDESWQPEPDLARFLESGPPPIVVTFGSMKHPDPPALSRLLHEAIDRVGCRAIVQSGWSGLGHVPKSFGVHLTTGFIPHRWLFEHAACVVHHGAAGTTAAALRAGVPSVIVPHALDQFLWAEVMLACGAATSVVPLAQLSVDGLSSAINRALSLSAAEPLARLASRIRQENGVDRAIALLEQH